MKALVAALRRLFGWPVDHGYQAGVPVTPEQARGMRELFPRRVGYLLRVRVTKDDTDARG